MAALFLDARAWQCSNAYVRCSAASLCRAGPGSQLWGAWLGSGWLPQALATGVLQEAAELAHIQAMSSKRSGAHCNTAEYLAMSELADQQMRILSCKP